MKDAKTIKKLRRCRGERATTTSINTNIGKTAAYRHIASPLGTILQKRKGDH
jgi:hypothetical protein